MRLSLFLLWHCEEASWLDSQHELGKRKERIEDNDLSSLRMAERTDPRLIQSPTLPDASTICPAQAYST